MIGASFLFHPRTLGSIHLFLFGTSQVRGKGPAQAFARVSVIVAGAVQAALLDGRGRDRRPRARAGGDLTPREMREDAPHDTQAR